MKTALFLIPLPPPVHGSSVMCRQIVDSTVIRGRYKCEFVNIATSRSMMEIGHFSPAKVFRHLAIFCRILGKLIFSKVDICYIALKCDGAGFLKDAPFALLCKLFGKKLIIHQHNKGMSSCINRFPYKRLIPLVYKNARVILLSWRLYDDIKSVVDKDQVTICPNGIPDMAVHQVRENHDIPHILFLSNLIMSKGVLDLLDACNVLKKKGYEFVCDYVGKETPEITAQKFNEEVRSRDLENVVFYHGAKYGEDKESMWSSADIFVFPTFYENEAFPLVILEAMQNSLPVVTYHEGGIPDMVIDGQTGFICPKNDVEHLADKIETLLMNPRLAVDMGMNGNKLFKDKFTLKRWETSLAECIDI